MTTSQITRETSRAARPAVVVVRRPGVRTSGPAPRALTARESQVLTLVAHGRTNKEIAGELYLSPNTVKTYIRTAYRTIGVERRTQATVWWWSHHGEPAMALSGETSPADGAAAGTGSDGLREPRRLRSVRTGPGATRRAVPGAICVAALSRSEITRAGVRAMLADYPQRVTFVDHHGVGPSPEVAVAIFELTRGDLADLTALEELAAEPLAVVVMVSPFRRDLTARSLALGARAWVSTDITGPELVGVVESTWARVAPAVGDVGDVVPAVPAVPAVSRRTWPAGS